MIWTIYPFKSFYLIIRMVELFLSENSNKFLRTSINNFSKKIYLLLLPFVLPFLQLFKECLHFILYGSKFPQQELHPLLLALFSFHRGPVRSCSNCVVSQVPLVHTGLAFLLSLFLFFLSSPFNWHVILFPIFGNRVASLLPPYMPVKFSSLAAFQLVATLTFNLLWSNNNFLYNQLVATHTA